MSTVRSQHWRDDPHPTDDGKRQRTVRNWMHYRVPGSDWQETDPRLETMTGPPHDWTGAWDFSRGSSRAPLQFWARDAMDAGNRALVGFRVSERPGSWLNVKALDIAQAVDAVWSPDGASVSWPGLWANSTLRYVVGAHKASKEIVLSQPGHPASFAFTIKLPPGHSLTLTPDGGTSICDGSGVEALRIRAPYGYDSATTAPTLDGRQRIRVTLTEGPPRGGFRTLVLTPHASDLAGAVYPVTVDPTVTITDPAALDEAMLFVGLGTNNFGGSTYTVVDNNITPRTRTIARVAQSAIPDGTITDAAWWAYRYGQSYPYASETAGSVQAYAVLPHWVEGTADNAEQTGSCCWTYAQHDTLAWNTGGCQGSGSDYEADASPPTTSHGIFTVPDWVTIALRGSWFERWKAGTLDDHGWILHETASEAGLALYSTEYSNATLRPYVALTYTPPVTSHPYYYHVLNRRRRS